jgi:hypothetical protein
MPTSVPVSSMSSRLGATGRQDSALDRPAPRHAEPGLKSDRTQFAPFRLFEGGRGRGVLTSELRPDCPKRRVRIAKQTLNQDDWRRRRSSGRYLLR